MGKLEYFVFNGTIFDMIVVPNVYKIRFTDSDETRYNFEDSQLNNMRNKIRKGFDEATNE